MRSIQDGELLWKPSQRMIEQANMTAYMRWLEQSKGRRFESYRSLWRWSTDNIDEFWVSIINYFDVTLSAMFDGVIEGSSMPEIDWFPGARLNYAENVFNQANEDDPAIIFKSEDDNLQEIRWSELQEKTQKMSGALRKIGVQSGDRVVAYLPNIPEAIISLLAAASIGAVWSSCSPDFGSQSVLDRFQQIEPKILIAADGYRYNGKLFDRRNVIETFRSKLPTLEKVIIIHHKDLDSIDDDQGSTIEWKEFLADADPLAQFEQVPFEHPLWVLYSSGTTGLPKPIVHGHGGILLEHLKMSLLHLDLRKGDRFFWYTSTGWMMWNFLAGGLLAGATIVLYDGSPTYPDLDTLWQLAEDIAISYFGTSAAYITANMKSGIVPAESHDLSQIRAVGSTGSPLTSEGFGWIYENVNRDLAVESISGGTDLCTAFVGGCRLLPVYAGEIQTAALGAKVEAFDERGKPVKDQVGELVITKPMPSMPIYFWGDQENRRYKESYFKMFPGVWRHGDWIKINQRGGCIIYGRSDSTINRQGVRMGTSEIYRAVDSMPEVVDSLVVDLEILGGKSFMPLFVILNKGTVLDTTLKDRIKQRIKQDISPRHVPNAVYAVSEIPYTLSGKKMEVPVRRILLGEDPQDAANPGAMRNPESIQYFVDLARQLEDDD